MPTVPSGGDARRSVPRTDALLADPLLRPALERLGRPTVKTAVRAAQDAVRSGTVAPEQAVERALAVLPAGASSLRPVVNATGVVLHTNLGRAALAADAVEALVRAAGYVDVEYDLATGRRSPRGGATLDALRTAVPRAGGVLAVNNGAAALLLAVTVLAAGREVVISRGEMVEIGDGFRLPDLLVSTGARLREVGTTNRTSLEDYALALGPDTGAILKVHPSNFAVVGFTSSVSVGDLAGLGATVGRAVPVVADIGSGLLAPDARLVGEPDAASTLRAGAALVTASADKLLGGPQAGLVLGEAALVERCRRHPLARALRLDKLALAALEATLRTTTTPTHTALHADPAELLRRAETLAARCAGAVVAAEGAVGGGGAPGLVLPGWGVALPRDVTAALRCGDPAIVGRTEHGHTLLDLRCVPADLDDDVAVAVLRALSERG